MEIAVYRKLVESEEDRLGIDGREDGKLETMVVCPNFGHPALTLSFQVYVF